MPKTAKQPAGPCIRILAYVNHLGAVTDMNFLAVCHKQGLGRDPALGEGYVCDVTVELQTETTHAVIEHYGDGVVYPTFEAARERIRELTGIEVEAMPEESPKEGLRRVACYVREFMPTDKSREAVEEESPMSVQNFDAVEWLSPPGPRLVK